jgi:hypothetical protein
MPPVETGFEPSARGMTYSASNERASTDDRRPDGHGPPSRVTRPLRHTFVALLIVAAAAAAFGVAPAAAKSKTPCWKVLINDWYDGRIDGIYPIHCYREALKHLPADVDTYSSARDDIKQALQKRISQGRSGGTTTTPNGGGTNSGGSTGGGTSGGGTSGGGTSGGGNSGGGTSGGGTSGGGTQGNDSQSPGGPIPNAINDLGPKKADSVPVPLLVLGGVAVALMAAGAAGFLTRRSRLRRLQLASAASVPHGSETEPTEPR